MLCSLLTLWVADETGVTNTSFSFKYRRPVRGVEGARERVYTTTKRKDTKFYNVWNLRFRIQNQIFFNDNMRSCTFSKCCCRLFSTCMRADSWPGGGSAADLRGVPISSSASAPKNTRSSKSPTVRTYSSYSRFMALLWNKTKYQLFCIDVTLNESHSKMLKPNKQKTAVLQKKCLLVVLEVRRVE